MKDLILQKFSEIAKNHPATISGVTLFSAARITASIVAPIMFVDALEALQKNDHNTAIQYFGIYSA